MAKQVALRRQQEQEEELGIAVPEVVDQDEDDTEDDCCNGNSSARNDGPHPQQQEMATVGQHQPNLVAPSLMQMANNTMAGPSPYMMGPNGSHHQAHLAAYARQSTITPTTNTAHQLGRLNLDRPDRSNGESSLSSPSSLSGDESRE